MIKYNYLLFYVFVSIFVISCKPNIDQEISPKPVQKDKVVSTQTKKAASPYMKFMRKNISLSDSQFKAIDKVIQKYNPKIAKLKKEKKWSGPKNKTNRTNIWSKRDQEIKKLIGEKKFQNWKKASERWIMLSKKQNK